MDQRMESRRLDALKAYVAGDSSEPVLLSVFRDVPPSERSRLVSSHRRELEEIDDARLTILESVILPWDSRSR